MSSTTLWSSSSSIVEDDGGNGIEGKSFCDKSDTGCQFLYLVTENVFWICLACGICLVAMFVWFMYRKRVNEADIRAAIRNARERIINRGIQNQNLANEVRELEFTPAGLTGKHRKKKHDRKHGKGKNKKYKSSSQHASRNGSGKSSRHSRHQSRHGSKHSSRYGSKHSSRQGSRRGSISGDGFAAHRTAKDSDSSEDELYGGDSNVVFHVDHDKMQADFERYNQTTPRCNKRGDLIMNTTQDLANAMEALNVAPLMDIRVDRVDSMEEKLSPSRVVMPKRTEHALKKLGEYSRSRQGSPDFTMEEKLVLTQFDLALAEKEQVENSSLPGNLDGHGKLTMGSKADTFLKSMMKKKKPLLAARSMPGSRHGSDDEMVSDDDIRFSEDFSHSDCSDTPVVVLKKGKKRRRSSLNSLETYKQGQHKKKTKKRTKKGHIRKKKK